MRCLILLALSLLGGCATTALPPALPLLQISPAAYGASLQLTQRLTVQQAPTDPLLPAGERQLDTLLQLDAVQLRLVALALGQRVLTLSWDGQTLDVKRHPMLPASVDAQRVLRDIALVFAPLDALRAALPPGWTMAESANERTLRLDGQAQLRVRYLQGRARVEIDNLAERYQLRIESTEAD